jgi:Ca-activated chloride channel homolog
LLGAEELASLQPVQPGGEQLSMTDHHVEVVIENGFARVAVSQTFRNPGLQPVEAIYRAPLPQHASLSEVSVSRDGAETIHGEVVEKSQAKTIYESEKQAGNDAGLATKEDYRWFEFRVTPVPATATTTVTHVYYQPLTIDTGIGRFHYPRENGGTEDAAAGSFWEGNTVNEAAFSFSCELRSAWPVTEVRMPGRTPTVTTISEDRWTITSNDSTAGDSKDVVLYYRLAENLPGRVELIPFKPEADQPGWFMMVLTPGLDLKPVVQGSDWTFVLDRSGSMQGKITTLADGVSKAVQRMRPEDRFRILSFSDSAQWVTKGWQPGTPDAIRSACESVSRIASGGGTDLYAGISQGLSHLDADRAAQMVLVTDGVANLGQISPKSFYELSRKQDIRIHGFLLGNSANWPLMELITQTSGGTYAAVSNEDDIVGQIILAKEKVVRESLHGADLSIRGVRVRPLMGPWGKFIMASNWLSLVAIPQAVKPR